MQVYIIILAIVAIIAIVWCVIVHRRKQRLKAELEGAWIPCNLNSTLKVVTSLVNKIVKLVVRDPIMQRAVTVSITNLIGNDKAGRGIMKNVFMVMINPKIEVQAMSLAKSCANPIVPVKMLLAVADIGSDAAFVEKWKLVTEYVRVPDQFAMALTYAIQKYLGSHSNIVSSVISTASSFAGGSVYPIIEFGGQKIPISSLAVLKNGAVASIVNNVKSGNFAALTNIQISWSNKRTADNFKNIVRDVFYAFPDRATLQRLTPIGTTGI